MAADNPLTILISGDRYATPESHSQEWKYLEDHFAQLHPDSIIVHGGCKGIDLMAAEIATALGLATKSYPVSREDWRKHGRAAGPLRNQKMLDDNEIDYLLACHPNISQSRGTKDMMQRTRKAGITVYFFDGKKERQL